MVYIFRFLFLFSIILPFSGCTEPNPEYDPAYVPPCKTGSVQCSEDLTAIMVCQDDGTGSNTYINDKECWSGTQCESGYCGAGESTECNLQADCENNLICTAVPSSRNSLSNYCIPSPNAAGLVSGKACSVSSQCQSGWCFKKTCYTPCNSNDDCPFDISCSTLNVTIDGIKGTLKGCAIGK